MKTLTVVLMVLLAGSSAYADQERRDGFWCESTPKNLKAGYVSGL